MGIKYTTLIECKHYKNSISREKVQVLYDKIRQTGANKGILISTSNFQSGAIQYASEHGIALIQITDDKMDFVVRDRLNVYRNHSIFYDNSLPFIGIMLQNTPHGISCQYLKNGNTPLKDYLCDV